MLRPPVVPFNASFLWEGDVSLHGTGPLASVYVRERETVCVCSLSMRVFCSRFPVSISNQKERWLCFSVVSTGGLGVLRHLGTNLKAYHGYGSGASGSSLIRTVLT